MKKEKLMLKGKLLELKTKLKENEIIADGLIAEIRIELNPVIEDFLDMDMEKIKKLFDELYIKWLDAKDIKEKIEKIEEEL